MKVFIIGIICIFFTNKTNAQDTIFNRTGETIAAKILEINTLNVKYKKFDFQDGPIYIVDKGELVMIKYSNGSRDNFMTVTPQATPVETDYVNKLEPVRVKKNMYDQPIDIDGYLYRIGNSRINVKRLDNMLLDKKDKSITQLIKAAQSDKQTSKILSFATIPLGVGAYITFLYGATISSNQNLTGVRNNNVSEYFYYAGLFATTAITSGIIASIKNKKSKQTRLRAVETYNATYYRDSARP